MSRPSRHTEKLAIKGEIPPDNRYEETAARTRPFSYDEIMHRRKSKKKSTEFLAQPVDAGNLSGEISKEAVPNQSESGRPYRSVKLSSIVVAKHSVEDAGKVDSRNNEDNLNKDRIRSLEKDSRDREIRSKPTLNRHVSDKAKRSLDDRRDQWNRTHDNWSSGNMGNEFERRSSKHLIEKERYTDKSRGRPVDDIQRKHRNHNEERKTEREIRNHNEERKTEREIRNHNEERKTEREIRNHNEERKTEREIRNHNDERKTEREIRNHNEERKTERDIRNHSDERKTAREIRINNEERKTEREIRNHNEERKTERESRNHNEERKTEREIRNLNDGRKTEREIRNHNDDRKTEREIKNHNEERKTERDIKKHNDDRKIEREAKRKHISDDDSRQNALKKHDSGKRRDQEAPKRTYPERKEKKESSQFYNEELMSKKKRSRSREHSKDKGRPASLSPRSNRRTSHKVREHGDASSQSIKDRSRREEENNERNRISKNGSSGRYPRSGGNSSGLGGYSPRKRRTEAGVKTPSPPHRSPEKKPAGWDLAPSGENTNSTASVLPNMHSLSHIVTSNADELPNMAAVTSMPVRVIRGVFPYPSVDSVQLTQATRPMRRLYLENLPASASEKTVMECLNNFLLSSGVNRVPGSQPCISCTINKEKEQGLVEFLTPEDASAALYFDGRYFSGSVLRIRRPKDYSDVATGVADKSVAAFDLSINIVRDSPNKIFIGGIPKVISSEMLREIAAVFGHIKAFRFEVNVDQGGPCAFLEYADQSVTLKACVGLNGMRLGGQTLTVVQATPDASSVEFFGNPPFYGIPEHAKPLLRKPTQVLKLKNVLCSDGLSSLAEQELEEISQDVRLECTRFGTVNSVYVVKHRDIDSMPEICQAPDGIGSANDTDTGSAKNMKSLHHGEQIDGGSQETSMPEVPCDNSNQNEEYDRSSEDEVTGDREKPAANVDLLGNSEMTVEELASENNPSFNPLEFEHQPLDHKGDQIVENIMTTDTEMKNETMVQEVLDKEEVPPQTVSIRGMNSSEVDKDENKEVVFKLKDDFEPGSILVEYKRIEASTVAAHNLHGRLFDDRTVTVEYVDYAIYSGRFLK